MALSTYVFSFTAASALISDFVFLAGLLVDGKPLEDLSETNLTRGKSSTQKREFNEFKKRLAVLDQNQLELLVTGTYHEQQLITHLALIKCYRFYRDFCEEVLLRKVAVFDMMLTDWDYNSFLSQKKVEHPELDKLAETTQRKVKQVVLLMLQQVGLLEQKNGLHITPPLLPVSVERIVVNDDPTLLHSFLYDDQKILLL